MRRASIVQVLSFSLTLGMFLAATPKASAQASGTASVKIGQASAITRVMPRRKNSQKPLWVSRADCIGTGGKGDVLTFPITMTGYSGYTLQVWAGTVDCTPTTQRVGGSGSTCWQVFGQSYTGQQLAGGGFLVPLYARNIVAQRPPILGSTATSTTNIPEADVGVCSKSSAGSVPIALYFMLVDGTGTVANNGTAGAVWKDTAFDISPPAPPTGIVLGGGEGHINISWTNATNDDITGGGYNFYCDPPPGPVDTDAGLFAFDPSLGLLAAGDGGGTGAGGAGGNGSGGATGVGGTAAGGAGGTAGAGGAGGTAGAGGAAGATGADGGGVITGSGGSFSNCAPTSLLAGSDPDPAYLCGSVSGNTVNSGKAENLVNDVEYVVAISAVDTVGNVGKLSQNHCASPVQVTDFFELYKDQGGKGGGLCSLSAPSAGQGSPASALTALGAVVSVTLLRRMRRRS